MRFKATYYRTHRLSLIVRLESVLHERTGELFFAVTAVDGEREISYVFKHLSSALDFINCNFAQS